MRTIITHATSPGAASEQPLQVALVVSDVAGGIARHVEALADYLAARGHSVQVLTPPRSSVSPRGDVAMRTVDALRLSGVGDWYAGIRALRQVDVDVVHAHGLRAGAAAARAITDVPVVVTLHNAPLGQGLQRRVQGLALRAVARRATEVIAASSDLRDLAVRAGARRAVVVPVVAPPTEQASEAPDASPLPDDGDRPVVLAVARLAPQKRLDVLVDAAPAWTDDPSHPVVWVVGDGPEQSALQRRIDATDAPVRLLGRRYDVAALLARAEVFALSSDWEARPLVLQEAMRAAVPVVATAVGGVPELVGDAAMLVPPRDPDALRDAIARVIDDRGLAESLAARGRAQAATWPSLADSLAAVEAVYGEATGN